MTSWISVLAAVAAVQTPGADALRAAAPPTMAEEADWARKPSISDLTRFYPQAAKKDAVGGDVTLACRVDRNGGLTGCAIAAETPSGYGFGQAALKIAETYMMREDRAGRWAASDRRVLLPIAFRPPGANRLNPEEWVPRPYRLRRLPRPEPT